MLLSTYSFPDDLNLLLDQVQIQLGSKAEHHHKFRQRYIHTIKFVVNNVTLEERSNIAEIGPGPILPALCKRFKCSGAAYGLLQEGWEPELGKLGITWMKYDANSHDFPPSSHALYDCVLFLEVIEHLNRWPFEILQNASKILKPGGRLILSTVNFVRLSNRVRMLFGKSPLINPFIKTEGGDNHIREFSKSELMHLFHICDLHVQSFEYWQFKMNMRTGFLIQWLCKIIPSLSSHMFFCLRR